MKELNHTCAICGVKYNHCNSCDTITSFTPWRAIVDSIEHYKIFLIIRDYHNKHISKEEAKSQLKDINLEDINTFVYEIQNKILEILEVTQEEKYIESIIETEDYNKINKNISNKKKK